MMYVDEVIDRLLCKYIFRIFIELYDHPIDLNVLQNIIYNLYNMILVHTRMF